MQEVLAKTPARKKSRVYILSEEMRVPQSPFFMEGTDLQYDIPDEYPLPMETTIVEDGVPIELRLIPSSRFIEKEKQIKEEGRSLIWEPSDQDRKLVTFKYGRLATDAVKNQNVCEYLDRVGWNKANIARRKDGTKVIFEEFDEDLFLDNQIATAEKSLKAQNAVMALSGTDLRNVYLASIQGGGVLNEQMPAGKMKVHLLELARENPDFILDGITSERDQVNILIHKAIEYGIVTLDISGLASIQSAKGAGDWDPIVELSEAGGMERKFNRFADYLLTDQAAAVKAVMEQKVQEAEAEGGDGESGI